MFEELNAFQKLYFKKGKEVVEKVLKNDDKTITLGENKLKRLLNMVSDDDFKIFKNETILIKNKFHLLQLLHHIIKCTKRPYLYIDYVEQQVDTKLFYACIESIIFNSKLVGKESKLEAFKNYQFTKVLRSERVAELVNREQ